MKSKATRIHSLFLPALLLLSVVATGCRSTVTTRKEQFDAPVIRSPSTWPKEPEFGPGKSEFSVFDLYVGFSEGVVREMYGAPMHVFVERVANLGGEMYLNLHQKLKRFPNTPVKQMYYDLGAFRKFLWLVQNRERQWIVVSDVTVPAGMYF